MLGPVGHLASAIAYAVRRGARREADRAAVADVHWRKRRDDLPKGLELQWLGTSGFRLSYEGHDVLIDPYLTRVPLRGLRRAAPGNWDTIAPHVGNASAILIGHTHFDHAMDAPLIARRYDAPVYGGRSLVQLMELHGVGDLAVEVQPHRPYAIGPFTVTFVPSLHSKLALGLWIPSDGELSCEHLDELTPLAYRCGQTWGIHVAVAGVTFYHQGSCDLIEGEMRHRGVDYLLAGISGRRFTPRYVERLIRRLEPRVVVPHHWDDFFRPLDGDYAFSLNVNLAHFLDEVRAVSKDLEIRALVPGETVGTP
jgi:L-ascorbate metabolism protein UlaG (beta-lactamase superfamily)